MLYAFEVVAPFSKVFDDYYKLLIIDLVVLYSAIKALTIVRNRVLVVLATVMYYGVVIGLEEYTSVGRIRGVSNNYTL